MYTGLHEVINITASEYRAPVVVISLPPCEETTMCQRLLLSGNAAIATFRGTRYKSVSVDARCQINRTKEPRLNDDILSFQDSSRPGCTVMPGQIQMVEFTDEIPDECLVIDYTGADTEIPE